MNDVNAVPNVSDNKTASDEVRDVAKSNNPRTIDSGSLPTYQEVARKADLPVAAWQNQPTAK